MTAGMASVNNEPGWPKHNYDRTLANPSGRR